MRRSPRTVLEELKPAMGPEAVTPRAWKAYGHRPITRSNGQEGHTRTSRRFHSDAWGQPLLSKPIL